jgi:hypothetical protein
VTEHQEQPRSAGTAPAWTLLSNHGHVLVCLALDPEVRMRDVAIQVGITERAVQMIVHDLIEAGLVVATKVGRRNRYTVVRSQTFRHPLEANVQIGPFTDLMRAGRLDGGAGGAGPAGR